MQLLIITVEYTNDINGNKTVSIKETGDTLPVETWARCQKEIADQYGVRFVGRVTNAAEGVQQLIFSAE